MKQEDKDLLLKDLCVRLSYKTYVKTTKGIGYVYAINTSQLIELSVANDSEYWSEVFNIDEIKPYLRPLSSMSDEEYEEFGATRLEHQLKCLEIDEKRKAFEVGMKFDAEDLEYLYSHHYDVRGLIPKGLALSTEEFNPYKD